MMYTKNQIIAALALYDATGSAKTVINTLGYPSNPMLYHWIKKYPEYLSKPHVRHYKQAAAELKEQAIRRCLIDGEPVRSIAEDIGYTESIVYKWLRSNREKGICSNMKKSKKTTPSDLQAVDNIEDLKEKMLDMQMEIDILKETINVLKKDPGVDYTALRNREKAVIIGALKNKNSLPKLCLKLEISRSSYYYQEAALRADDKYRELRSRIIKLFQDNRCVYGYRKIHQLLKQKGTTISEKIVRRIMKEESLVVKMRRRRKYNSYQGELSVAPENLVNRDFHADKPNEKWLTDITEFSIPSGKVYLSPVIDCFDGTPVSWRMGVSPNANLVNAMLRDAISTLSPGEKPIIHSDRGCHYRWSEWIKIVGDAGLTRSMSRKGCSPDNAACEGFFGHLKNEMFYNRNWDDCTIPELIQEIDSYIRWYRTDRIKSTLGGLSPLQYRKELGVAV